MASHNEELTFKAASSDILSDKREIWGIGIGYFREYTMSKETIVWWSRLGIYEGLVVVPEKELT
jgi:hypothetical protein